MQQALENLKYINSSHTSAYVPAKRTHTELELDQANADLEHASRRIRALKKRSEHHRCEKRKETLKLNRISAARKNLEAELAAVKASLGELRASFTCLNKAYTELSSNYNKKIVAYKSVTKDRDNARQALQRAKANEAKLAHKALEEAKHRRMKLKGGVISEAVREMIRELAASGVPERKIFDVVHAVARGLGIMLEDSFTHTSVQRIVREGGIASYIQIGEELKEAKCKPGQSQISI